MDSNEEEVVKVEEPIETPKKATKTKKTKTKVEKPVKAKEVKEPKEDLKQASEDRQTGKKTKAEFDIVRWRRRGR